MQGPIDCMGLHTQLGMWRDNLSLKMVSCNRSRLYDWISIDAQLTSPPLLTAKSHQDACVTVHPSTTNSCGYICVLFFLSSLAAYTNPRISASH